MIPLLPDAPVASGLAMQGEGAPRMPARVRRAHKEYDDIHELNGERNNNHWRHSYGLIAEGSTGNDFLGAGVAPRWFRTPRGGRADGNR